MHIAEVNNFQFAEILGWALQRFYQKLAGIFAASASAKYELFYVDL